MQMFVAGLILLMEAEKKAKSVSFFFMVLDQWKYDENYLNKG